MTPTTDPSRDAEDGRPQPPNHSESLLALDIRSERDVFALRSQAKAAAAAAGLDARDQVRLAAALSELGRDLLRPAPMTTTFALDRDSAPALRVDITWNDERVPEPESLAAVTRLLPGTRYQPAPIGRAGAQLKISCRLPGWPSGGADAIRTALLAEDSGTSAIQDLQAQTRDLIAALEESHAQRDQLEALNRELQETNEGVIAMYTELSAELEETNRGVVALYGEEHTLALTLQRTFLPASLPSTPGVELAVRYLASTSQAEIGGDFYEAVHTAGGLLLAVGDVVGHSLQAAVVMGELRHALRAYAAEDSPPHVLLEKLDRLLAQHQPGWTATVCIVLVDQGTGTIQVANAGHLPPLLIDADGHATYLREHGPLLGMTLPQRPATTYPLIPGSRLLMVTDGLIETRTSDLSERLDALRRSAAAGPGEPEALCDSLLETFGSPQDDDIIVFAARFDPQP
ncbi:PP2C family protein-serine/threonine phosphatase [Streptacidiphilus sp. N1-12]|uniref:PP2C family protein-serine/threonine phosphatase n=2 Tax=Streptacidiphilus alkalitolerans TaxID=3342712 RepID=A0ABV6W8T4_9ACTN